jgi:hypothetical protein
VQSQFVTDLGRPSSSSNYQTPTSITIPGDNGFLSHSDSYPFKLDKSFNNERTGAYLSNIQSSSFQTVHSLSSINSNAPVSYPTMGPTPLSPAQSVCSGDSFTSGKGVSRRSHPASSGGGSYYAPRTLSATQKRMKYLRRLVHFRHMDFEYALWQMWYLFTSPQKVYRNFQHRKRKNSTCYFKKIVVSFY